MRRECLHFLGGYSVFSLSQVSPMKLVRPIKMCLAETYSIVHQIDKHQPDIIPIKTSLKQDAPSILLYKMPPHHHRTSHRRAHPHNSFILPFRLSWAVCLIPLFHLFVLSYVCFDFDLSLLIKARFILFHCFICLFYLMFVLILFCLC